MTRETNTARLTRYGIVLAAGLLKKTTRAVEVRVFPKWGRVEITPVKSESEAVQGLRLNVWYSNAGAKTPILPAAQIYGLLGLKVDGKQIELPVKKSATGRLVFQIKRGK